MKPLVLGGVKGQATRRARYAVALQLMSLWTMLCTWLQCEPQRQMPMNYQLHLCHTLRACDRHALQVYELVDEALSVAVMRPTKADVQRELATWK
eukprot:scaffold44378_cov20-Tisochrysis_lutea.AAC.1